MRAAGRDRLADIARRCAGERPARVPAATVSGAEDGGDERFSRGAAVRLALAGAVAASLGVTRPAGARAASLRAWQSEDACRRGCLEQYERDQRELKGECRSAMGLDGPKWLRVLEIALVPIAVVKTAYHAGCRLGGTAGNATYLSNCLEHCRDTCRSARSLHGGASGSDACRAPRPPQQTPVPPPQPPSLEGDQCAICQSVGGACCGYAGPDKPMCACATILDTGAVPCDAYGC